MLNQLVIIGRVTENPELIKGEEKDICNITIAIPRNYKNTNGEFETDFIPVILWQSLADNVSQYCHKGDLVGIKGRIEVMDEKLVVIAEKVTFLANNKNGEE